MNYEQEIARCTAKIEVLEQELEELETKKDSMSKEIKSRFGTNDLDKLKEIAQGLEEEIKKFEEDTI